MRTTRHLAELDTIASNLVWQDLNPSEEISDDEAMDVDESEPETSEEQAAENSEMEVNYPY